MEDKIQKMISQVEELLPETKTIHCAAGAVLGDLENWDDADWEMYVKIHALYLLIGVQGHLRFMIKKAESFTHDPELFDQKIERVYKAKTGPWTPESAVRACSALEFEDLKAIGL